MRTALVISFCLLTSCARSNLATGDGSVDPSIPVDTGDSGVVADGGLLADAGILPDSGTFVDASTPPADPAGFRVVSDLLFKRNRVSTTLLQDGRVLIVGGQNESFEPSDKVEIFDPSTNLSSPAASLPEPRAHHTATRLNDGRVLIAGGGKGNQISLPSGIDVANSAFIFDPKLDQWHLTGALNEARAGHQAVALADGRILVVGGGKLGAGYACASPYPNCTIANSLASAEIFDPKTERWATVAPLKQARIAFSLDSTPLGIIAAGGAANNNGLSSVEIFDTSNNKWNAGPPLNGQRLFHASVVIRQRLAIAGGKIANVKPKTSFEILDADGKAWVTQSDLDIARTGSTLLALRSGKVLILGGSNQLGERYLASAALYDLDSNTWESIQPLSHGRYNQSALLLNDGSVLVVGGLGPGGSISAIERSFAAGQ